MMIQRRCWLALLGQIRSQSTVAVANDLLANKQAPDVKNQLTEDLKSFDDVPGPKGLPFFGTALNYVFHVDGFSFDRMFEAYKKLSDKYGPIYKEKFGPHSHVVITDFREYSKVIRADGKIPKRIPLEPLLYYRLKNGLCSGMVNGNGETWYKYRAASHKKLLRPAEVVQYLGMMDEVAKDLVTIVDRSKDEKNVIQDTNTLLFRWSMESVNTFLLDARLGTLDVDQTPHSKALVDNIKGLFECMQKLMFDLPAYKYIRTPMWRRFERHCDSTMAAGMEVINQRLSELNKEDASLETKRECLISYLLKKGDLSNYELSALLVEVMVGSVETASNTLLWCIYLLATNPRVQQKVQEEVDRVVGQSESITLSHINKLPYVKACLKETQRLYPVTFATSRILNEDIELFGYRIPADTHVQANLCSMFRDPSVFSDPHRFIPERWMNREAITEDMAVTGLVWGHGARMCIGRRLAEQELNLGLTRLVQKYKLEYPDIEPPSPILHTIVTTEKYMRMRFLDRTSERV